MITHLRNFFAEWSESFKIYYLSYIVAFFGAVLWIMVIYYGEDRGVLYELLATCGIAFPLFLLAPLSLQIRKNISSKILVIGSVLATILSVLFGLYVGYYNVFDYPSLDTHIIITSLSYLVARSSILGVVASGFPRDNLTLRGWRKEIFSHIIIAGLGSLILRGGISASLGSIDYLFDVNIDYKLYLYVGVISFLLIGVSIFLTKLSMTEGKPTYENFLRFFGLYIFFPLAIIYAAILLTYGLKIVTTGQRPKGLISMMVIGYTIWGLISYFLTYPLETTSFWKQRMQSTYFVSILVFVFLLLGAIGIRISQYGITEQRYLILMIAVWIIMVAITSLIWPSNSLRTMIFTLIGLAISSAYLPRGAGRTALESQSSRFITLAQKSGLYQDNGMIWKQTSVDSLDKDHLSSLATLASVGSYIERYYGLDELRAIYGNSAGKDILVKPVGYYEIERENIFLSLGLTGNFDLLYHYQDGIIDPEKTDTQYFSLYSEDMRQVLDIVDYRYMVTLEMGKYIDTNTAIVNKDGTLEIRISGKDKNTIDVYENNQKKITIDISDFAQDLYNNSLQNNNKSYRKDREDYSLVIKNASGIKNKDNILLESVSLELLIK